jgi:hypothetical protein
VALQAQLDRSPADKALFEKSVLQAVVEAAAVDPSLGPLAAAAQGRLGRAEAGGRRESGRAAAR